MSILFLSVLLGFIIGLGIVAIGSIVITAVVVVKFVRNPRGFIAQCKAGMQKRV